MTSIGLKLWQETPGVLASRDLGNGRYAVAFTLLFHYTVISARHNENLPGSYDRQWCFHDPDEAILAVADQGWDGVSDPKQEWHKSRHDGRVRVEGVVYASIEEATHILNRQVF